MELKYCLECGKMRRARKIRGKYGERHRRARCRVFVMLKVYFALLVLYLNDTTSFASLSDSMLVRRKNLRTSP